MLETNKISDRIDGIFEIRCYMLRITVPIIIGIMS